MGAITKAINEALLVHNATGINADELAQVVRDELARMAKDQRIAASCESDWSRWTHQIKADTLDELAKTI